MTAHDDARLRCAHGHSGKPFQTADAALDYFVRVVEADLAIRVAPGRARSFRARLLLVHCFYNHVEFCRGNPYRLPPLLRPPEDASIAEHHDYDNKYRHMRNDILQHQRPAFNWSADHQEVLRVVDGVLARADANIAPPQF